MTLFDVVVVLSVFGFFGYIIFAKMYKSNPELIDRIRGWLKKKEEVEKPKEDITQQVYIEKRELI